MIRSHLNALAALFDAVDVTAGAVRFGGSMKRLVLSIIGLVGFCAIGAAMASETVTYTYDAKGRLVKVERSGTVNNGLKAEYTHDKADNRTNVKVTGSPNTAP
jgi:hypothetical protein